MHHVSRQTTILFVLLVLIIVAVVLLIVLLRGEPATGSVQSSDLQVITADGSSFGQTQTIDDVMPAPSSETFQETPKTPDLQQQPPSTDLQEPGGIE